MSATTPLRDAALSIGELEEEIRRANDRRYAFTRMLAATDRVLWRLEELNRRGVKTISVVLWGRLYESLMGLPPDIRALFARPPDVQDALDSVFDVQERLFRWHDPEREEPDEVIDVDYAEADLVRWAEVCEALDRQSGGVPKGRVSTEDRVTLEAMHEHQLVFLRDRVHWRAYASWPARLERLRAALEVGEGSGGD